MSTQLTQPMFIQHSPGVNTFMILTDNCKAHSSAFTFTIFNNKELQSFGIVQYVTLIIQKP